MKSIFILLTTIILSHISFGQTALEIEKQGKGSPILFLPGFTSPGSVWDETIKHLSQPGQVHVASYAGFNGLDPIGTPWYEPIKQELIDYIQKQKLSDWTIVGHSMGGNLALDLAAELKNQVSGLILVDAIPCMRELMMPNVPASALQYDSPYNQQMLDMNDDAFYQYCVNIAENMTNDQEKKKDLVSWSLQADRETLVYGYTDLLKLDLRPLLSELEIETLIIGATWPNPEVIKKNFEKQYAPLKNKTITLADDSKHFVMFDQPTWFYQQVNQYLARRGK